jgi:hypothetical protein
MSFYDDEWSSRRQVTVPYLNDEPDDEEDDTKRDYDTPPEPVRWVEVAAVLAWIAVAAVVLAIVRVR